MTRRRRKLRHGRVVSGILACYLAVLLVAPLVHDEVACARTATHCVTCTASGMAAATTGRVSSVNAPQLSVSAFVRAYGHRLSDTILPFHKAGRSPPDLPCHA